MANLDTALKRLSGVHVGSPWRGLYPFPDSSVDTGDRQTGTFLYSGIASTSTVTITCSPGTAIADGITAAITRIIPVTPGGAVADGITAAVTKVIAATPGAAVADGVTATIELNVTILCTPGNAVADGITATISGPYVPTISVVLTDALNAVLPNLTGLRWAWWDQPTLNTQVAPIIQGTGASTNASGEFSVTTVTGSSLTAGQVGWIEVTDSDGTTSQSPVGKVAAGPVTLI